jgi:hypothetical protein
MSRATWVLAATTVVFASTTAWLYLSPREQAIAVIEKSAEKASSEVPRSDPWTTQARMPMKSVATAAPALPAVKPESRMERRQRHQQEFAAMFGRAYGDVLDYTNKAIADGQLSPYDRNAAG